METYAFLFLQESLDLLLSGLLKFPVNLGSSSKKTRGQKIYKRL